MTKEEMILFLALRSCLERENELEYWKKRFSELDTKILKALIMCYGVEIES